MIGILLLSHGKMAQGMYESSKLFFGDDLVQMKAECLEMDDDIDGFDNRIKEGIAEVDDGHGVIVMCDLMGGTPYNRCAFVFNDRVQVIAGMNFPLLLELMGKRLSTEDISEIDIDALVETAKNGVMSLNKLAASIQ